MCAIMNKWEPEQQGLHLTVSLSGLAQSVLGDLPLDMNKNYDVLVKALEDRFYQLVRLSCTEFNERGETESV